MGLSCRIGRYRGKYAVSVILERWMYRIQPGYLFMDNPVVHHGDRSADQQKLTIHG